MGLITKVLIGGGLLVAGGLAYRQYQKKKAEAAAAVATPGSAVATNFAKPKTATQSIVESVVPKGSSILTLGGKVRSIFASQQASGAVNSDIGSVKQSSVLY